MLGNYILNPQQNKSQQKLNQNLIATHDFSKVKVYTTNDNAGQLVGINVRRDGQSTDYRRTNRGACDIFDQQLGELHDFFYSASHFITIMKNKSILDLGCGGGKLVIDLCQSGINAKGVDLVIEPNQNKKHASKLIQADAFNLPFVDHSFDMITSIWSVYNYEPAHKIRTIFDESIRVIKPGGSLLLSAIYQNDNLQAIRHLCKLGGHMLFASTQSKAIQIIKNK